MAWDQQMKSGKLQIKEQNALSKCTKSHCHIAEIEKKKRGTFSF
jgi:hypothetical protein